MLPNTVLIFKTNRKGTHVVLPAYFITEIQQADYYVKYGTFLIFGLDILEANAEAIKEAALSNKDVEQFRTLFYDLPYIQDLLKKLEEK